MTYCLKWDNVQSPVNRVNKNDQIQSTDETILNLIKSTYIFYNSWPYTFAILFIVVRVNLISGVHKLIIL